jgi:dTDP-4-amino-4,6-dideoxygalactose transaminase
MSSAYRIPFNRPTLLGNELDYIREAVARGHLSGDGHFALRCAELLQREHGSARALMTPSCTHALELAALLLELRPGDEVIVPSFAFVTTAAAFALHGARPVFADVSRDTLNLDPARAAERVGPRTRAIVALHYAGVGCDLDALEALARRSGLRLIEDNAHGLFARRGGVALGSRGALATLSFHETKNFTGGEGGALLVNDPALVARAEILREKGTNRSRFFRGEVDKYTWVDHGSSYLPSELVSAFLFAQLEAREAVQAQRARLWQRYARELADWAKAEGAELPTLPQDCESAYHLFALLLPTPDARARLIAHLRERGILAVFHYQPLHLSPMGQRFGGRPGDCPVSEDISERLLRLPLYHALSDAEQSEVIDALRAFRAS